MLNLKAFLWFEIFPQVEYRFNLMFGYQVVGGFEVYQDEILLPNGICQIMKKPCFIQFSYNKPFFPLNSSSLLLTSS
ncbi:hypothetical protein A3860_37050 [Niastella vici]|uniref:Uncharacterized protein n=1 Tax=Niastella vici TaxID=1703345 RepID=A0A1V9FMN4_9BACT|nr:hypothetical protein A3860_37050 [Niastella vici]